MNRLLLLVLLGYILLALAGAADEEGNEESLSQSIEDASQLIENTEALAESRKPKRKKKKKKAGKGKKKGKKGKKKGKKRRNRKKKSRKSRKMKKKTGGQRKKKGGFRRLKKSRSTDCSCTCLANAMKYLKTEKDLASNYLAQKKRIERQNKTGDKKSGKKGLFAPVLVRLVEAGGGNRSNLSCQGSATSSIAKQLANLSATLIKCESTINTSCNPLNFPLPKNITQVIECETKIKAFLDITARCLKKSGAEACTCWANSSLATYNNFLKNCSLKTEAAAIAKQKSYCTGNFSVCRKYEDDVGTALSACSQSPDKLVYKAKALKANIDAIGSAKTVINSKLSSGRAVRNSRSSRAAPTTCAEMTVKVTLFITMGKEYSASPNIAVIALEVAATPSSVACSAAEQASLTASVVSIDTMLTDFALEYSYVAEELMVMSGSTPSAAAIASATEPGATANSSASNSTTAASNSTTAASGRRRRQLIDGLLRNKKEKWRRLT